MSGAFVLMFSVSAESGIADPLTHLPLGEPITGLNHACGTAVDPYGDVYLSSAGDGEVKVYDPEYNLLASIADPHEPCSLAVDSKGTLYVSNQKSGEVEVVKYTPNVFPLSAAPTYSAPTTVDPSESSKGIAVDGADDRLYVAEGNRVSVFQADGTTGEDEVQAVVVQPSVTGGTFKLKFEGQVTTPILFSASPVQLQSALEALSTIGAGNVSVEEGNVGTRSYLVEFTHALGSKDVPTLSADSSGLTGGSVEVNTIPKSFGRHDGFEFNGHIGEGELSGASAVAAYANRLGDGSESHYLFVATNNKVEVLRGPAVNTLSVKETIDGSVTPDGSFGFGATGGALGLNPTDGHLFVYDDAHKALDEFEASGRYLDQTQSASFEDAEPSGIAVLAGRNAVQELEGIGESRLVFEGEETSAKLGSAPSAAEVQTALEGLATIGAGNVSVARHNPVAGIGFRYLVTFTRALAHRHLGRISIDLSGKSSGSIARTSRLVEGSGPKPRVFVTAGASTGAKLLAFSGLPVPGREALKGLSRKLPSAAAVATDSHGDVYVAAGTQVHVYRPNGSEINVSFEDEHRPIEIAVDSTGKVYVLDKFENSNAEPRRITYYTPSAYPPIDSATYLRHEPPIFTRDDFGGCGACAPASITVNPSNDHVVVMGGVNGEEIKEFDSVANGSGLLRNIAPSFGFENFPVIRVCGATGEIFVAEHAGSISVLNAAGTERVAQFDGGGSPTGPLQFNPGIAVDQSNCHVLVFPHSINVSPQDLETAREFDARGGFVTSFGSFTAGIGPIPAGIAVDNSGGPSDGNVYVAYDDPSLTQEFDLFAFAPLSYGEAPAVGAGEASALQGGEATLNGTVNPRGFELEDCRFEYLTASEYKANQEASLEPFTGATAAACAESLEQIGEGTIPVPVHADLSGLQPGSHYRFRLIASNEFGKGQEEGLFGPPEVETRPALPVLFDEAKLRARIDPWGLVTKYRFEYGTTESYGQSTPVAMIPAGDGEVEVSANLIGLSEGQTYHFRVSAENEASAQPVVGLDQTFTTGQRLSQPPCENAEFRTGLSAGLPDCRAYELITPAETNGLIPSAYNLTQKGAGVKSWLVVPRGGGAGERVSYFTKGTLPGFDGNGILDGYRAERAEGAHPPAGWSSVLTGPTYEQAVPDFTHEPSPQGLSADQLYSFWHLEPAATFPETLPEGSMLGTPSGFEPLGRGDLGTDLKARDLFLSAAATHVIFASSVKLEDEVGNKAPPTGTEAIYDRSAGSAHATVISVKPDGSPFGATQNATYLGANEAGTAVVFAVGGKLYLHTEGQSTEVAPTYTAFDAISEDGKRLFYNDASGLEVFNLAGGSETIETGASFLRASPDGSHVLYAKGSSPRELYVWDGTASSPLAQLAPSDPAAIPTRSTPDGEAFLFQSAAQLSAYDNEGKTEIYRYGPTSEPQLICVSCDPSGAPPGGGAELVEYDGSEVAATTLIQNITDDGQRVFFESPDRLLPQDANDVVDVYEWMAAGSGGCEREAGCLALISSGQGETRSHLYGMSADGHDVFFLTREKLLGADLSGSPSIYDARQDGGIPEALVEEACQGDACQGAGSEPPTLPSPATSGEGKGNHSPAPRPPHCRKGHHRVHGRCVPKKHHKHRRHAARTQGAGR